MPTWLTLWLLVSIGLLVGCAMGIRGEGCDVMQFGIKGIWMDPLNSATVGPPPGLITKTPVPIVKPP